MIANNTLRFLKMLLLSGFFMLITLTATGQDENYLIPYRSKNKWGFADKNGQIVIKPKYQDTNFFEQFEYNQKRIDLAKTKFKNKWGLIDNHTKVAIPFEYDSVTMDYAAMPYLLVREGENWGIHKLYGKLVVACTLDQTKAFEKAIQLANDDKNKLSLGDLQNPTEPETDNSTPRKFYEYYDHLKWVKKFTNPDGSYKLPGTTTKIHLPFEKDKYGGFYYWYKAGAMEALLQGKWGLVDTSGQVLIPFKYDSIVCYNYGSDMRLAVRLGKKVGILSRTGKIILPIEFDEITDDVAFGLINPYQTESEYVNNTTRNPGIGWVKKNGKWYVLNPQGKLAMPDGFDYREEPFGWGSPESPTLSLVRKNGKFGIIVAFAAKKILLPEYDSILINYSHRSLHLENIVPVLVKKAGKYGLYKIDLAANCTLTETLPIAYDSVSKAIVYFDCNELDSSAGNFPKSDGFDVLVWGKQKGNWKLYQSEGKPLIQNEFKKINYTIIPRSQEELVPLIAIQNKQKWGVISARGKAILPFAYDTLVKDIYLKTHDFPETVKQDFTSFKAILVKESNIWKAFNYAGNQVATYNYEVVKPVGEYNFSPYCFKGKTETGWEVINSKGIKLSENSFEDIQAFPLYTMYQPDAEKIETDLLLVKQGSNYGLLDQKGKIILPVMFSKIENFYHKNPFMLKVWQNKQYGYIDIKTGRKFFKN